jgi:tetratricopeptide (TPR) repeat protein
MRFVTALMTLVLPLTVSCGGRPQPTEPDDATLRQSARAAGLAYSLDRPEQAIAQYERALERARERDDATAIGDYGYNLIVVQLAANHPRSALATARTTRAELARRGVSSFSALDLAEATALYRLGEKNASDRLAMQVESGGDVAAAARASFLRGLIADETNNPAGLDQALTQLVRPTSDDQRADAGELQARRHLRHGALEMAAGEARHAADLRRQILDYRGMARALSVAADAEARAGHTGAAAELYMRAGQSAAAQGDTRAARAWLSRAVALGTDPTLRQAAKSTLALLGKVQSGGE